MNKPTPVHPELRDQAHQTRTTSAGWMLQRLACMTETQMQTRLKVHGLKMDHFIVLMALTEKEGASQTEIGEGLRLAGYTVSRALDALEKQGLVERKQDAQSRRTHRVFLTDDGRALMPSIFGIIGDLNKDLLDQLPAEDQQEFLRLLTVLTQAVGSGCG
ncbi:transcriptional regulator, MarR family [Aliiroseovarius halocynthiae]|uniref:Winged helix-turn-helix transcriptional regulator n=1 Tax=Aliiroseovarius halocynthiae TaxID=985055 RepID=A0A545SVM1_9RHOB|nr:MarR family winged helix-turn-helix transcriptional regulator [Aliiroseovarius halocynthiae]TQV69004.1 winged helix-turn-helix transcriptional regulator [Aliiroseovarius halocynthiae]SMR71753.1 transcriptional regulator, MarR family [Aliiroseovarius halocynthiae]